MFAAMLEQTTMSRHQPKTSCIPMEGTGRNNHKDVWVRTSYRHNDMTINLERLKK